MAEEGLNRLFLQERDLRVFEAKKRGIPTQQIATTFGMTTKAVNAAVQRQLARMNSEAMLAYPEMLRMELERLETLQAAIWPLTQQRKVRYNDGAEVIVDPDLKAVAEVRAIMAQRAKLLGMDQINLNVVQNAEQAPQRAVLADVGDRAASVEAFSPETEALQLIQLMGEAGVLPPEIVRQLTGAPEPAGALEAGPAPDDEILTPDEVYR